MKKDDMKTGEYIDNISEEASLITAKARPAKVRRVIFLILFLLICFGGIALGYYEKKTSNEKLYNAYWDAPDRTKLTDELISYKDIFKQFQSNYLGNEVCQSLMGGYFYNDGDIAIYPNDKASAMILFSDNVEKVLCIGLITDINVKDGCIFFRTSDTRKIYIYDTVEKKSYRLALENVGQFVVCDDEIFYIDMLSSSLMMYNFKTQDPSKEVKTDVSSFAVIGNSIIFLDNNQNLYELNLTDSQQTLLSSNVATFSYNGTLWIQNNDKIYYRTLSNKALKGFDIEVQCHRLLGTTETMLYVESLEGISVIDIETGKCEQTIEGTFVGASEDKLLIYSPTNKDYQIFYL